MIQCRPHGITNSTLFSVRRISPVATGCGRADDQVDALGRAHLELPALADQRLGLVRPHPGGVDDLLRPDLDTHRRARGPATRAPTTRSPSRRNPTTRARLATARRRRRRCARASACAARRRSARRSTGRRRPGRPRSGAGASRSACGGSGAGAAADRAVRRRAAIASYSATPAPTYGRSQPAVLQRVEERNRPHQVRREPLSSSPRSCSASRTSPKSSISRYRRPPWISLLDRLTKCQRPVARLDQCAVSPRVAASRAAPAPTTRRRSRGRRTPWPSPRARRHARRGPSGPARPGSPRAHRPVSVRSDR